MKSSVQSASQIVRIPIDPATSITQLFSQYADKPWSMLLDSANSNHSNGRFDIFVADPIATITAHNKTSQICHINGQIETITHSDPIALVESLLAECIPTVNQSNPHQLPFQAGAMGLFGYDLGRVYEDLPNHAQQQYSAPDLAVGIYTWSVIKDNHNGEFFLCYLDGFSYPDINTIGQRTAHHCKFSLTSEWQSNMAQFDYYEKIDAIHHYLQAGDCYQVNLAQRFSAQFAGSPWQAYLTLRESNKAPFSAYIQLPDCAILSISPERFLSVAQKQVQTKPIKGTRPRSTDTEQDNKLKSQLQSSAKDRAENLMIVDLLRNDLSKNCLPNSVQVPELFAIESFSAVHHLVSTVTGTLNANTSPLTLLKDAFPGGSITGAPKIRAMEIIDELEPHRRNIYCGSIGYLGTNKDMDTSICIRTLLCEDGNIYCWAGGGIVLDSKAEDEFQESLDKVAKILPVLSS